MEQANLQSIETGCDESILLDALLIQEATERSRGNLERALMIFEMEVEMVQHDQCLQSLDKLREIMVEIIEEQVPDTDLRDFKKSWLPNR